MAAKEENSNELPRDVYMQTASYALEHGEIELYRQSNKANTNCKDAIEEYISSHFKNNILNMDGVGDLVDDFGTQRMAYVLANTLHHKNRDGRFSYANKRWAETIPVPFTDDNSTFGDNSIYWTVQSHPALLNMFINTARDIIETVKAREQEVSRPLVADDITDLRLLSNELYDHEKEYVFTCMVRGKSDTLTYTLYQHDDGESFYFHTEKDNIWDRMDISERGKLESALYHAATFGLMEREIKSAKTTSDLEVAYIEYMETDFEDMSQEQWNRIGDMMHEKEEELLSMERAGIQQDAPSKEQDSLKQKAVKPKRPKI